VEREPAALPRDLPSLTSLRTAAALLVFVFHLGRWGVVALPGAGVGETGVGFFFALSGFLLTWGYAERVQASRFYIRRFARIVPSHAAMWVVAFLVPVLAQPITWPTAAVNLPLLQAWIPVDRFAFGMNGVTWSLSCEVAFYAAFPMALLWMSRGPARRAWTVAAGAFALEVAFCVVATLPHAPEWMSIAGFVFPPVRFPEFLLGIAAALAVRSGWRPRRWLVAAVIVWCLAGMAIDHSRPADDVWLAPVFLLVIVEAASWDCSRSWWLAARPLVYAGKVSFAFYLVHELAILNMRHVMGAGPATAAAALGVSCLAAVALHHGVELPAQKRVVQALDSVRRTTPSDPVTS
jgi:peptidoglycan/LPS O-acetylase OafA/YrhL